MLALIAAIGRQGQLGLGGGLPWGKLGGDMRWFFDITTATNPVRVAHYYCDYAGVVDRCGIGSVYQPAYNALIMGRRTWEGLPGPLAGRKNIVLRHYPYHPPLNPKPDLQCCALEPALYEAREEIGSPNIFIVGGAQVYAEALRLPELEALFLTEVQYEGKADTWWPFSGWDWEKGETLFADDMSWNWRRTHVSSWIEEPKRSQYRFGIWEKVK